MHKKSIYKYVFAALLIVLAIGIVKFCSWQWELRVWFDLQDQQMATIKRLDQFPPKHWTPHAWEEALVTTHNVWGNVTFSPDYSQISIEQMRSLQHQLEQIVAETTSENSVESVDRIYQLLLDRERKQRFITGYRDEFKQWNDDSLASTSSSL